MPSFKYGARTFTVSSGPMSASTAASLPLEGWTYLPSVSDVGTFDKAAEIILSGALTLLQNVASAASTAAGGSVIVAATQYNSLGNSVNSTSLFNQALGSQAADVPIDTTLLHKWTLSPGDLLVLGLNSNTVGIPANFPGIVWSVNVGAPPG